MQKFLITYTLFIFLLLQNSCTPEFRLNNTQTINYPSGSGITSLSNRIYIIGDDATHLLITDINFTIIDSIKISESNEERIPKEIKPDLEAATIVTINNASQILLVGSGSLSPYRNTAWLVGPDNKQKIQVDLKTFYSRLKKEGIEAVNIEGITSIPGGMVLSSRGNKTIAANYLIFTSNKFWNNDSAVIKITKAGTNSDTAFFNGVSGLEYSTLSDRLLLTVSTENTYNAIDDGSIGKSYLWVINNISAKKNMSALNPNKIYDLEALDNRFKGHKIESVCIISENKKEMKLVLVADNDKGRSDLFNITLLK